MPDTSTSKKRVRPVIEEIVDESAPPVEATEAKPEEALTEVSHEVVTEPETTPLSTDPTPVAPPPAPKKEPFRITFGFLAVVVIVAIIVALISGAVYVYFNGINSIKTDGTESTPTPTSSPTIAPSGTPEASGSATPSGSPAAMSQLKVQVLNGSGQPGTAGAAADVLEAAGFTVTNTGNAANFNFKGTSIQAKSTVPASVVKQAQDALAKKYSTTTASTALSASSSYDIIVTVGAE